MSCFSGSRLIKILTGYPEFENLLELTSGPHDDKAVSQAVATRISFWPASVANSLCLEQGKHTMRQPEAQIGDSGFIETIKEIPV
jgi:hypothetical protein